MTRFVYIHGFASAFEATNSKVRELEKLGEVVGFDYDSTARRDEILHRAFTEVDWTDSVPVGTSLGGYFAATVGCLLSRPAVAINPSVDPYVTLGLKLGKHANFVTGVVEELGAHAVQSYQGFELPVVCHRFLPLVLLDLGDEVLNARATEKLFSGLAPVRAWEDGSHRFEHMAEALPVIRGYLNSCEVV